MSGLQKLQPYYLQTINLIQPPSNFPTISQQPLPHRHIKNIGLAHLHITTLSHCLELSVFLNLFAKKN